MVGRDAERRAEMSRSRASTGSPLIVVTLYLLVSYLAACGDTSGRAESGQRGTPSGNAEQRPGHVSIGDGDHESPIDGDHDMGSQDTDGDTDTQRLTGRYASGFYDYDDGYFLSRGHEAGPAERRAIAALVTRYYKAAREGDGQLACSLLYRSIAESLSEDYGGPSGPSYLRGDKTCAEVLEGVFKHAAAKVLAPIEIHEVRLEGARGVAFLASKTMPTSSIAVSREEGPWKLVGVLANPLS
jgi:hypothetical protein